MQLKLLQNHCPLVSRGNPTRTLSPALPWLLPGKDENI